MKMTRQNVEDMNVTQDTVPIAEILVDESRNLRKFPPSDKALKELVEDIRDKGQLQPVIVRPAATNNGHKYELVGGYQRMRALQALHDEGQDVDVLVRVVDADDEGVMFANIAENMRRSSLSIVDLSYAIGQLKDGQTTKDENGIVEITRPAMTLKDISVHLGLSHGYVSELDKMRNLRPAIQKSIHNGEIIGNLARQLVKMSESEQDKALEKVVAGEVSQNMLAETIKDKSVTERLRAKKGKKNKAVASGKGDDVENVKKPLSAKKALLVLEDLTVKPKDEEGKPVEESEEEKLTRDFFSVVFRWLSGKIGEQAFKKAVMKLLTGD